VIESGIILLIILCIIIYKLYAENKTIKSETKAIYAKEIDKLQTQVDVLRESRIDPNNIISMTEHDRMKSELNFKLDVFKDEYELISDELKQVQEKNSTLISQRQSSHVRLGKVAENFYPLLSDFPYNSEKCTSILAPIDLIYWGEDDIVFVEIKSGKSQLSSKQRNIRNLVNEKKVRFETHTIGEEGIVIK
jgi:predicted Holliday junction resolvase-like endonuclease